jgi:hypothetical protein
MSDRLIRNMNPPNRSGAAAQECSPPRKLWVAGESDTQAPKGRKKPVSLPVLACEISTLQRCSIDTVFNQP